MNQTEELKEQIFKALGLPPQSEYSKNNDHKYNNAKTIDELLLYYGESVLYASASLIFILKTPNPTGIYLRLMKILNKASNDRYYIGLFNLISLGILFVVNEARQYIKENFNDIVSEKDYDDLSMNSIVYFIELLRLKKNKERKEELLKIYSHYFYLYKDKPVVTNLEIIQEILDFYEGYYQDHAKSNSKSYSKFRSGIASRYHLSLLDTGTFIGNYKRLKK